MNVAAAAFLSFGRWLRRFGFAIAPEQIVDFMRAVTLLGPRSMEDIRQAALATLAPPLDRRAEFDALFRQFYYGEADIAAAGEGEEEVRVKDDGGARESREAVVHDEKGGAFSASLEQLSARTFERSGNGLDAFRRALSSALPLRRSFLYVRGRSRGRFDLRRSLREIVRADGDIPLPILRRRRQVQRPLLILIDISGSMKLYTADYLELAHAAVQGVSSAEVFTFGTRLTRITPALRVRDATKARARVSSLVEDWDGGTRIGPALLAFLSVPRFAAFARGAAVLILTDGLERGDHTDMATAMRRLSQRAYRLSLATPLAGDPRFSPRTVALRAILPVLDDLVDGSSIDGLTRFVLSLARPAKSADIMWKATL